MLVYCLWLEQGPTPEVTPQLPPEVQEFQTSAEKMRADFTFEHMDGVQTKEGIIDYDSLGVALNNVSKASVEDPSVLGLVQAVNESNKAVAETGNNQPYRKVADRPEFGLLKLFGAARKVEQQRVATSPPEKKPVQPEKAKRFGHQILVDGQVVHGLIGPGTNEVTTSKGILRTYGTPRLG